MAEAQHEAFDEKAWSETMEPTEHVKTYENFVELVKVGTLASITVILSVLMALYSDYSGFIIVSSVVLAVVAIMVAAVSVARAETKMGPSLFVTIVAVLFTLFTIL